MKTSQFHSFVGENNISVSALSKASGIPQSNVLRIVNGTGNPTLKNLRLVLKALSVMYPRRKWSLAVFDESD